MSFERMVYLSNRTILIISPQPWGKMRISKHHYAIELSKNNRVYFLNPPDQKQKEKIKFTGTEYPSITQITYRPYFNTSLRFHAWWFYNFLMKKQVKQISEFIKEDIDIVWCYELNLYSNLHWFGAKKNIYHPVDLISYPYQIKPAVKANYIFSVSDTILNKLKGIDKPKALINHGLNREFAALALKRVEEANYTVPFGIKVGYIGNLLIHSIDLNLILRLVQLYPSLEFHFWGSYENGENKMDEGDTRVNQLKNCANVILHGLCLPEEITQQIADIDLFILTYTLTKDNYDRSNSHKILEYLSTGRVVVSTPLLYYTKMDDIIQMSTAEDNSDFIPLFDKTVKHLQHYNQTELRKKRVQFALNNTYEKQLSSINSFISEYETGYTSNRSTR